MKPGNLQDAENIFSGKKRLKSPQGANSRSRFMKISRLEDEGEQLTR